MKKIILLLTIIVIFSCNKDASKEVLKDYATLQGSVTNPNGNILLIQGKQFKKEITIHEDGTFSDTLRVTDGFHGFSDQKSQSFIYLKNGDNITLAFDNNDFPNSITFNGKGSATNNYLTEKLNLVKQEKLDQANQLFELNKPEFDAKIASINKQFTDLLENAKGIDSNVYKNEKESNIKFINFYNSNYEKEHASANATKKGRPSPKFNYPDTNGKLVSLDDLKGKYVYVDVWATWCGPCKQQIPFLKELDKTYENKDIVFVSMSIDKPEHKEKWLKMVTDEDLKGIQIIADKEWNSDFVTAYGIRGIPRFILIDKEGNIFDANAPRPSDPKLEELFNSLDL